MSKQLINLIFLQIFIPLAAEATTFFNHVRPIVENRCLTCHSEAGVSFSMEDYDVNYSFRDAMVDAVEKKRMPPWLAESGHMEYEDDYSLTDEEIQTFIDWKKGDFADAYLVRQPLPGVTICALRYYSKPVHRKGTSS